MKTVIIIVLFLLNSSLLFSQSSGVAELKLNGKVWPNNEPAIRIRGITFVGLDSVRLTVLHRDQREDYNFQAISNIRMLAETKHAVVKGASIGAVAGGLLGYAIGYLTYDDNNYLDAEENKSRAINKGLLFGVSGAVALGVTGAIGGGIIIRKKFVINGDKPRFYKAIEIIMN
jgi:hypothetical protein